MGGYLKFLFSPNGRISRKDIWLKWTLPYFGVSIVAAGIDYVAFSELYAQDIEPAGSIVSLLFLWPGIAVSVKRFHDRGQTGWRVAILYALMLAAIAVGFVPLLVAGLDFESLDEMSGPQSIGLIAAVIFIVAISLYWFVSNYCLPGNKGPNKYGADPLRPHQGTADAFS
jgi:uncharacterized membrane protein YhaH (DUF805 family)